jgi:hypothetical protein
MVEMWSVLKIGSICDRSLFSMVHLPETWQASILPFGCDGGAETRVVSKSIASAQRILGICGAWSRLVGWLGGHATWTVTRACVQKLAPEGRKSIPLDFPPQKVCTHGSAAPRGCFFGARASGFVVRHAPDIGLTIIQHQRNTRCSLSSKLEPRPRAQE